MDLITRATEFMKPSGVDVMFFHSPCLDGTASAFAYASSNANCLILPFTLGKDVLETYAPLFDHINSSEHGNVLFVDCCPTLDSLVKMREKGFHVMVLDHHIENERKLGNQEGCFFDMKRSGCMLAWDYFCPGKEMPLLLKHIGTRDLGDFSGDNKWIGMALMDLKISEDLEEMKKWVKKGEEGISELVEMGKGLQVKLDTYLTSLRPYMVMTRLKDEERYTFTACETNGYLYTNEAAEYLMEEYHEQDDFVVLYYKDDKIGKYKCSMRTKKPDVDVSKIAAAYGGGGHARAAGFVCDSLPW